MADKEKKMQHREAKIFQQWMLEHVAIRVQNEGRGEGDSLSKPLHLHPKFNSKWLIDLNVNCPTVKILEDDPGKSLDDLGTLKNNTSP